MVIHMHHMTLRKMRYHLLVITAKALYKRLISTTGLNARYENSRISFNSQTSYQFIKSHQGIDQDFTPKDLFYADNSYHQNMLSQELTLKSNDKGRYQWIIGMFGMLLHF